MSRKEEQESSSLKWLHRVRDEHYQQTKSLPLDAWLRPVDLEMAAQACRKLGLRVRVTQAPKQKIRRRA